MFDVVAVNIDNGRVRIIAEKKSKRNANAIETMAVMRRGVDAEFFGVVRSGKYKEGDIWG